MDTKYPNNIDPRPKRRKDKDNPYEIFTVGIETDNPHFYISFTDGQGVKVCMEIEKKLYELFDKYELEDLSFLNEQDRHYYLRSDNDESFEERCADESESVEDAVITEMRNEALRKAIAGLPEVQRRRLLLYYFEGMSYEEIAQKEKCTVMPIKRSIDRAKEKIKKFFQNRG